MNKAKNSGCTVNLNPFVWSWVVVLSILKLTGTISVSWWVVVAPALVGLAITTLFIVGFLLVFIIGAILWVVFPGVRR